MNLVYKQTGQLIPVWKNLTMLRYILDNLRRIDSIIDSSFVCR